MLSFYIMGFLISLYFAYDHYVYSHGLNWLSLTRAFLSSLIWPAYCLWLICRFFYNIFNENRQHNKPYEVKHLPEDFPDSGTQPEEMIM